MQTLRSKLRRFTAGGILLREVRAIRQELQGLTAAVTRIATELQRRNDREYGVTVQPNPDLPPVEISYADDRYSQTIADITARLTLASGRVPTEEEAFEQYLREHPDSPEAQAVREEQDQLQGLAGPTGYS